MIPYQVQVLPCDEKENVYSYVDASVAYRPMEPYTCWEYLSDGSVPAAIFYPPYFLVSP